VLLDRLGAQEETGLAGENGVSESKEELSCWIKFGGKGGLEIVDWFLVVGCPGSD
jgi:hypothetical protein